MDHAGGPISITAAPTALQGYASGESDGIAFDATLGVFEVPYDGLYEFSGMIAGDAPVNKKEIYLNIREVFGANVVFAAVAYADIGANNSAFLSFTYKRRLIAGEDYVIDLHGDDSWTLQMHTLQFGLKSLSIDTGL